MYGSSSIRCASCNSYRN
ncbi:MAG TPA: hypothetical protein DDY52_00515 [Candidatus Moranbacteria bacterium]|nr:hypothetical protein [Candidatus Moranbacteria bacterium]